MDTFSDEGTNAVSDPRRKPNSSRILGFSCLGVKHCLIFGNNVSASVERLGGSTMAAWLSCDDTRDNKIQSWYAMYSVECIYFCPALLVLYPALLVPNKSCSRYQSVRTPPATCFGRVSGLVLHWPARSSGFARELNGKISQRLSKPTRSCSLMGL